MKYPKLMIAALGAVTLTGATLTMTLKSSAQVDPGQDPSQQGVPGAGPRNFQGQPGQPGPGGFPQGGPNPGMQRMGMMGGGGGGAAMVADGGFLYVLQGGMLFKVEKSDLRVVGGTPLMPQGQPGQGQGQPGFRPPQGGQPGGPPPPPAKK